MSTDNLNQSRTISKTLFGNIRKVMTITQFIRRINLLTDIYNNLIHNCRHEFRIIISVAYLLINKNKKSQILGNHLVNT